MTIAEWLAAQGRTRFQAGDNPPPDVKAEMADLVRRYGRANGVPVVGIRPTAAMLNAALDWQEREA